MAHPTAHGTLTINVVTAVTLDIPPGGSRITVMYRGGPAGVMWFTLDGTTPVAAAAGTYCVTDTARTLTLNPDTPLTSGSEAVHDPDVTVRLLSAVAVEWSVMAS